VAKVRECAAAKVRECAQAEARECAAEAREWALVWARDLAPAEDVEQPAPI